MVPRLLRDREDCSVPNGFPCDVIANPFHCRSGDGWLRVAASSPLGQELLPRAWVRMKAHRAPAPDGGPKSALRGFSFEREGLVVLALVLCRDGQRGNGVCFTLSSRRWAARAASTLRAKASRCASCPLRATRRASRYSCQRPSSRIVPSGRPS